MSNLSFTNTQVLRNELLKRNLTDPYGLSDTLPINFTDSTYGIQGTNDISVIDQSDVSTTAGPIINNIGASNRFGPTQYVPTSIQTVILNLGGTLNYLESFTPSPDKGGLGLISILTGGDTGEGDTEMVRIARQQLKGMSLATMGVKLNESTLGRINALDAINDPEALTGLLTGREPIIERDYQITVPGNPITRAAEYFARVSGTQLPVSYIPGEFFDNATEKGAVEGFFDKVGEKVGQALNLDFTSHKKSYSQKLLQYTSGGQKSRLFKSVNYNKYQPNFDTSVGGVVNNAIGFLQGLAGLDPTDGAFYFGSGDVDPGTVFTLDTSSNSEKGYIVSGPSKMVKMFEGDTPLNTFPENDRTYLNGTAYSNTETQFIWLGDSDNVRGTIDGVGVQSNEKTLNPNSLLGKTQQIVQDASSLDGEARLKHPGHVISNVAYKYHDGYKMISKGNAVLNADGDDYCRVWTKDYGYDRYGRLVRYKGIQDTQRRIPGSVIRSQMMLNIAPTRDENGKPINFGFDESGKNISRYMFSIENLAWSGSDKLKERPICEQGPNDGRIMWFPPYDLKYTDDNRANWTSHTFLGRPEPIYTYNNTERTGTLSFKVVVDHPSIFNLLRKKLSNGYTNQQKQEIMDSFIAGCKDYDIYELANEFASLSFNEIETLESFLNRNSDGELKGDSLIIGEEVIKTPGAKDIEIIPIFGDKYGENTSIQLYWFNDIPGPHTSRDKEPDSTFENDFNGYIGKFNDGTYQNFANMLSGTTSNQANIKWGEGEIDEFKNILTNIETQLSDIRDAVQKTLEQNEEVPDVGDGGFSFEIIIESTTSAVATQEYNNALASRRAESLKAYLLGDKFENWKNKITITLKPVGENKDFSGINCNELQDRVVNGVDERIYSKSATYCRTARATIKLLGTLTKIEIDPGETRPTTEYKKDTQPYKNIVPDDPFDLILKTMHSECDYFYELKETDPLVFDNLVDKLKYFQPGFHSTTPEGLNKRLTFLQQCLRPGETIKVYDENNNEITDISSNTSFGRPPICVLRIGDFFHTKMVVDSINFTYDDSLWDMNPEGIGMQPMIASVNMGVKFIGGHGISNVINELQNALSFNYYANTEVYDEMATRTEGGRDEEFLDKIRQALKDKRTEEYANALNNEELSPDNDDYWGNLSEEDPNIITYNQFYNNFVENVNSYANELVTQTKTLYEKFGNSAVQLLFENDGRFNIISTTRYNTTDNTEITYLGRDTYDYNEAYEKVLSKVESTFEGNFSNDEIYNELSKKINFNENKTEEFVKINRFVLSEVRRSFNDLGTQIQDALSAVYDKQKWLQRSLDPLDIILGDEIDGYLDKANNEWVVKYLNNLTQNNGDLSGDVNSVLTKTNKLWEDYRAEIKLTNVFELNRKSSLKFAGDFSAAAASSYYFGELLPLFLNNGIFDIDSAIENNSNFNRQIRKKYAEHLRVLKAKNVKTLNIDNIKWENISETNQIYDFRITDTIDPANKQILKDHYDTIGLTTQSHDKEDSKGIWKEVSINIQPRGISTVITTPPPPLNIIPISIP